MCFNSNGLIHGPGETSDQARSDFLSAYTYANTLAPTEVGGDTILGGRTFTPGVWVLRELLSAFLLY